MNITRYIRETLRIKSSPSRIGEDLKIASNMLNGIVADMSKDLEAYKKINLKPGKSSDINDILNQHLGFRRGSIAPSEMYDGIKTIAKNCSSLVSYMEKKKSTRQEGLMGYLYSPQGAFLDRASTHMAFIVDYYVDVSRYIIAEEIRVSGISKAPAMESILRHRAISFCKIFNFYSSTSRIDDIIDKIPDIMIPSNDDISTAESVYKPGILDPLIATVGNLAFSPVRVGMGIKAEYDAKKYIARTEKVKSLKKMLIQLSTKERIPGVVREIETTEERIKTLHLEINEMEASVV